jgi:hypothetical protein
MWLVGGEVFDDQTRTLGCEIPAERSRYTTRDLDRQVRPDPDARRRAIKIAPVRSFSTFSIEINRSDLTTGTIPCAASSEGEVRVPEPMGAGDILAGDGPQAELGAVVQAPAVDH